MIKNIALVVTAIALFFPAFGWAEENTNNNEDLLLASAIFTGNLAFVAEVVEEEETEEIGSGKVLVPVVDALNVSFQGYVQESFSDGDLDNNRTRLRFSADGSPCRLFTELEIRGLQQNPSQLRDDNWLQQAWASCQVASTAAIAFGRVFPESGFSTFWPGGIITARYPTGVYPWEGYYAYGVNIKVDPSVAENWSFSGTISGRSDLQFDEAGQFGRLELAGRAVRSFGEGNRYGLTFQASEDFVHGGLDFKVGVEDIHLDGGVFLSDADNSVASGFLQVEKLLTERFAVHLLLQKQVDGYEVGTVGVGVRWHGFYLVGDYEANLDTYTSGVQFGLRYNW